MTTTKFFLKMSICGLHHRLQTFRLKTQWNLESKDNVKDRLFQKECRAVITLLLVLQLKTFSNTVFVCNALLILRN